MTGLDLARKVHGLRSDLPVLLLSGNSAMLSEEALAANHDPAVAGASRDPSRCWALSITRAHHRDELS
jgi:hypothetical protein